MDMAYKASCVLDLRPRLNPHQKRASALCPFFSAPAALMGTCRGPLVSNHSPASASLVDAPASKEVTAPSADDPSANAPVETSACRKRGAWPSRCSWADLRSVRLVRRVAAYVLGVLWWVTAYILFTFALGMGALLYAYFLLDPTLHATPFRLLPYWHRKCCRSSSRQVRPCMMATGVAARRSRWRTWASRRTTPRG